jgi:hypothetical protein
MPYIKAPARAVIDRQGKPVTPGELNYAITRLVLDYLEANGGVSYTNINAVMGAFASAQAEFYRRVAVPYEDAKAKANGDLPWPRAQSNDII